MTRNDCARIEALAGAIALGEATESDREAYRRHVSACRPCLNAYAGEREIERVMGLVATARDGERWEPDLRSLVRTRSHARRKSLQWSLGALAAAMVLAIGGYALVARSPEPLARAPQTGADPAVVAAVLPSWRDERAIASLDTTRASIPAHRAESLAIEPPGAIRDAAPLGGALVAPKLPEAAARELAAEGLRATSTIFNLAIDARGVPTRCTIERPSGLEAIDRAVCRAALQTRFSPRTANGRATASTYRDDYVYLTRSR